MALEQKNGLATRHGITGTTGEALSGPFAELKPCTPLEGVKLGGQGKDLRVGQRLRASINYKGHVTEMFPVRIMGRIYGLEDDEPQIILNAERYVKDILFIPESAISRRNYEIWSFRRLKPNSNEVKREKREKEAQKSKPVALAFLPKRHLKTFRVGQFVEGVTPDGAKATFFVRGINEVTKRPLLESLDKRQTKTRGELNIGPYGAPMIEEYTIVKRSAVRSPANIIEAFAKGSIRIGSTRTTRPSPA